MRPLVNATFAGRRPIACASISKRGWQCRVFALADDLVAVCSCAMGR
jgi:hypothetical protein